jgi:threonine/homoserine/homoserine lactone efflux protein
MTLAGFLAIYVLHLMASISPGPAVLMSARTGLTEGFRTGFLLAVGIGLGGVFWATAAISGLAVLFQTAPSLLRGLKLVGGVYLLYLAYKMWRGADTKLDITQQSTIPRSAGAAIWLGLSTQLTNPKTVAMFSAIFIGTVPPATPLWQIACVLLAVFMNEALWCSFVARIFASERTRRSYISLKSILDRAFGGMLALLGLKLATT